MYKKQKSEACLGSYALSKMKKIENYKIVRCSNQYRK